MIFDRPAIPWDPICNILGYNMQYSGIQYAIFWVPIFTIAAHDEIWNFLWDKKLIRQNTYLTTECFNAEVGILVLHKEYKHRNIRNLW